MKTAPILILSSLILTAACATTPALPITSEPQTARVVSTFPQERLRPSTVMTVRTYDERGAQRTEVGGLTCELSSDEIAGTVVTPGQIAVPSFDQSGSYANRGRPDQILVSCEGGGLSGNTTVVAQDKELVTATNVGLAGAILSTAISAAVAANTAWKLPEETNVGVR